MRVPSFSMWLLLCLLILVPSTLAAPYAYPLSVSGRRIVDINNQTIQFRCANWPGHMETMMPEGLQWRPLDELVALLAAPGIFNCIRLTYSVDLFFLGANLTARQSLTRLGFNATIEQMEKANPSLLDLPLLAVRDAVVLACNKANIMILFDNQVSRSEWCCSTTDGNGWWGDRYFNVSQWRHSLRAISQHYSSIAPNAVAYSLRNELRSDKSHTEQVSEWLYYVPMGIEALHLGDPNALIFVSGLAYDHDWTFLESGPLDNATAWLTAYKERADKLVFESHVYGGDYGGNYSDNCTHFLPAIDHTVGFPNRQNRPHVLTEMGLDQNSYPNQQTGFLYFECVSQWINAHTLGWGVWLFSGSYYVRNNVVNSWK